MSECAHLSATQARSCACHSTLPVQGSGLPYPLCNAYRMPTIPDWLVWPLTYSRSGRCRLSRSGTTSDIKYSSSSPLLPLIPLAAQSHSHSRNSSSSPSSPSSSSSITLASAANSTPHTFIHIDKTHQTSLCLTALTSPTSQSSSRLTTV